MPNDEMVRNRIYGKTDSGIEFSIEFRDRSTDWTVESYFELEATVLLINHIKKLRGMCHEATHGLYIPKDEPSNQMRKLCLATAASYPKTLPLDFIENQLGIPYNSYKVYVSARDYESRNYLSIDENKGISISIEGVLWTRSFLD